MSPLVPTPPLVLMSPLVPTPPLVLASPLVEAFSVGSAVLVDTPSVVVPPCESVADVSVPAELVGPVAVEDSPDVEAFEVEVEVVSPPEEPQPRSAPNEARVLKR